MPKPKAPRFRVTKSFDHIPRPNVVQAFEAGQEPLSMTQAAIARGLELGALEEITSQEDSTNGET